MSSKRNGATPGGPAVSAVKRKRLDALDGVLSAANRRKLERPAVVPGPTAPPAGVRGAQVQASGSTPAQLKGRAGEFPYNPLEDSLLDGSLSAALANAKAASQAAATATISSINVNAAVVGSIPGYLARAETSGQKRASALVSMTAVTAAAAAVSGSNTVAAEVLAQLIATNPRAGSDLRSVLEQRLRDKTVVLDNPPAQALGLGGRRVTNYSSKLRSKTKAKAISDGQQRLPNPSGHPSYQSMLRVHELWLQYTRDLERSGNTPSGTSTPRGADTPGRAPLAVELLGAMLTVVRHTNPQFVGATGILLRQSGSSLHIVAPDNRLRVVPTKGCTAHYNLNGRVMRLGG